MHKYEAAKQEEWMSCEADFITHIVEMKVKPRWFVTKPCWFVTHWSCDMYDYVCINGSTSFDSLIQIQSKHCV